MKQMQEVYLGIDVGSVSTNIVAITDNGEVVYSSYIRTNGQPLDSVKSGLKNFFN